jgi:hypothetical protein
MQPPVVGGVLFGTATLACMCAAALAGALGSAPTPLQSAVVADIPVGYLVAYRTAAQRFQLAPDGWAYLAGVGKVESDHGRSSAPGVQAGQNAYGCCAGPMQINNGGGSGAGTWGAYRVDGDGDGHADIYDADDAVATAARYLRANGAPSDWRRALFAYNHATWYVDRVTRRAAAYLAAVPTAPAATLPSVDGEWLAPLPGFPGERCDRRIVGDVALLTRAYGLRVTDCFGGRPHEVGGEHPLGLATDLVPVDGPARRAWPTTSAGRARARARDVPDGALSA